MNYVEIPLAMIELGRPLPVNLWDSHGKLLMRKGQLLSTEEQRSMLASHQACATEADARAWQRSFERLVHRLLRDGAPQALIARTLLPADIGESDYVVAGQLRGGWLDLQEVLRGILYQGGLALSPLARLESIEQKAFELLKSDPDEGLFTLFQALADLSVGYCATHALLCAVVCELTAEKLGLMPTLRRTLFRAALTMNIGMAREQDVLAQHGATLSEAQKHIILEHPRAGEQILAEFGVLDEDHLDLVRWHHEPDEARGLARNLQARRILRMADGYVAKMAARKTRAALSPVSVAKLVFLEATPLSPGLGAAMASALGFYPPGTYVELANGEKAVCVGRGARANAPHVVSIVDAKGLPNTRYVVRDTLERAWAIKAPLSPARIKVHINPEKIRQARQQGARLV